MNEKEMQLIADRIYKFTGDIIAENNDPFAVAAIFTMVALQIYKTRLSEKDYNEIVNSISENRDQIKSLTEMVKNDFLRKFH